MAPEPLTAQIAVTLFFLGLTFVLLAWEVVRIDVAALSVLVLMGLAGLVPGLAPIVPPQYLVSGFSSGAVVSIMAVMIIGAGLERTGLMDALANAVYRLGGRMERRTRMLCCSAAGLLSSFMQNTGTAALFLPTMGRIAQRTNVPLSRLLLPMGFCAIVGGTLSMVGSSPLIILNDLMRASAASAPEAGMVPFGLFAVTPVGLALLGASLLYFRFWGEDLLPEAREAPFADATTAADYFERVYGSKFALREFAVGDDAPLVGVTLERLQARFNVQIVGLQLDGEMRIGGAALAQDVGIAAGALMAVAGSAANLERFGRACKLRLRRIKVFRRLMDAGRAGVAELVVPPNSDFVGHSARDMRMRSALGFSLLAVHRGGRVLEQDDGAMGDLPLQAGDALVIYTQWRDLARQRKNNDFIIITDDYPKDDIQPAKRARGLGCLLLALALLASPLPVPVALLTGALGMVLLGVLDMDDAYDAISWRIIFLLAGLIPLGTAVEHTGTANWLAGHILALLDGSSDLVLQLVLALATTAFTLVITNVGAAVLLVPVAINMALATGANPSLYALLVALCASNAFLIPTHPVNIMISAPVGYKATDFLRVGAPITLLFIAVSLLAVNLLF